MSLTAPSPAEVRVLSRDLYLNGDAILRKGLLKLLAIKDSDIRILTLLQARDAVDKGLHSGGAFSAVVPLVALYYGSFIQYDVTDPTRRGQDMFTLSKGHAVAAMASVYAELGYFGPDILKNSRSHASVLNGHPGPVLPGVHLATGPMGQGIGVAQGFAIAGRTSPKFDSYCMVGDGELQEGFVLGSRDVRRSAQPRQLLRSGGSEPWTVGHSRSHPLPHASIGQGVRGIRVEGAQHRCDHIWRRYCGTRRV